jgi:two-component sensor histidine kinase
VEGPDVQLAGAQAQSLGLAVHELATNALKHGALSAPDGRVEIRWTAGAPGSGDDFRWTWIEGSGPAVRQPDRHGFGSRLLTRVVPQDLGGTAELGFRAEGLRFELRTRMTRLQPKPLQAA